jgi:hypothetical protein
MPRWSAPAFAVWFWLLGCGREIVLGDSEKPLPSVTGGAGMATAGPGSSAGSSSLGGSPSASGSSAVGGSDVSGSAGLPSDVVRAPGTLLWSADHEQGELEEWQEGGDYYGGEYEWGSGSVSVGEGAGHNGSRGLVTYIDTDYRDEPSQGVRLYRRIEDAPAYYSVWLKLADRHSVNEWWSIFLFHARDSTQTLENDVSLWDVRVVEDDAGAMTLQFFDHDTMQGTIDPSAGRVQPGEWFELTAYVDYQPPSATRIRILHDGALLFDLKRLHTSLQENVFWALGNGADSLTPSESTIYLDDAAIRRADAAP